MTINNWAYCKVNGQCEKASLVGALWLCEAIDLRLTSNHLLLVGKLIYFLWVEEPEAKPLGGIVNSRVLGYKLATESLSYSAKTGTLWPG